jgi:hypothetical protein
MMGSSAGETPGLPVTVSGILDSPPSGGTSCLAPFGTKDWRGSGEERAAFNLSAGAAAGLISPLPRLFSKLVLPLAASALLAACAASQTAAAVQPGAPGFLHGLWHGFIFPFAFIASLFVKDVAVYAVPNAGLAYNLGFFVGIVFLGAGKPLFSYSRSRSVRVVHGVER